MRSHTEILSDRLAAAARDRESGVGHRRPRPRWTRRTARGADLVLAGLLYIAALPFIAIAQRQRSEPRGS